MPSQARMKLYLEQTPYLEYQCTQLIPKYWLDAKIDPGSKSSRKKTHGECPSNAIAYTELLVLAKDVPGWQAARSHEHKGRGVRNTCLAPSHCHASSYHSLWSAGLTPSQGNWAGHTRGWVVEPSLPAASKYLNISQEESVSLDGCCWPSLFLLQAAAKLLLISVVSET